MAAVYNHVLRLNLQTKQWSLVDNYGDIPGVRMGHTANLWQGDKLLVYGGENEHRAYLSDVIIFDLKTAHWTQPELHGPMPRGRARHSAVIHDEKLFVLGGMTGHENYVLDDICYLDLRTWTWSRTWKFVQRYDHTSWIWGGRIWVFGGLTENQERTNEIWWLDLQGTPFDFFTAGTDRQHPSTKYPRMAYNQSANTYSGSSTAYAANSSSIASNPPSILTSRSPPVAPGSISTLKFQSGPELPTQVVGTHFHTYSSGCLLDFVTPATVISSCETSLTALDLETLRWQKLAAGKDLFHPSYRWHYCTMNEDGTHAWLLGCPTEQMQNGGGTLEEFLSDVLPIDLRKLGLLGNRLTSESRLHSKSLSALPPSDSPSHKSHLSGMGADFSTQFNVPPEQGGSTDFIITGNIDDSGESVDPSRTSTESSNGPPSLQHLNQTSQPIYVHNFLLQARWPHFKRLWKAQMNEFHTKKMHVPEPYSAVKAFLYYLYTDSIAPDETQGGAPTLQDVGGMLVMSNIYDMPRLRLLCVNRLGRELDVEHAAMIWDRAGVAGEEWLKLRAATFCMTHWGRVVRTSAFRTLRQGAIVELCEEIDHEGRVVGGEELEVVGGLGGGRFGFGGTGSSMGKGSAGSAASGAEDPTIEVDDEDDGDMDIA